MKEEKVIVAKEKVIVAKLVAEIVKKERGI